MRTEEIIYGASVICLAYLLLESLCLGFFAVFSAIRNRIRQKATRLDVWRLAAIAWLPLFLALIMSTSYGIRTPTVVSTAVGFSVPTLPAILPVLRTYWFRLSSGWSYWRAIAGIIALPFTFLICLMVAEPFAEKDKGMMRFGYSFAAGFLELAQTRSDCTNGVMTVLNFQRFSTQDEMLRAEDGDIAIAQYFFDQVVEAISLGLPETFDCPITQVHRRENSVFMSAITFATRSFVSFIVLSILLLPFLRRQASKQQPLA